MTVLSGAPFSVNAVGLKVYFDGATCGTGGVEGFAIDGLGVAESLGFGGIGGV